MITAKILNSEASINSFFEIDDIPYVPGENLDIVVRLHDGERDIRLVATNAAAIITLSFTDKTNPALPIAVVATVIDAQDRSMWKASLTQAQTALISGSNIEVKYDTLGDGTIIFLTVLRNVLAKQLLTGNC